MSSAPAQQGTMPFFVRKQKRRKSLHLPSRGSALPSTINTNDPRPKRAVAYGLCDQKPAK